MDNNILIKFPPPINTVETKRILGNTTRETRLLSTTNYLKENKYSQPFIQYQLLMMDFTLNEIEQADSKIKIF